MFSRRASVLLLLLAVWQGIAGMPRLFAGERYAFLVAVRQYDKRELTDLKFTESDVTDLAQTLLRAGYRKENVVLMTQARGSTETRYAPTAGNIRHELQLVLDDLTPDDSLLVALSGHGVQFANEKDSYFCPSNAKLADRQTLVSLGEIYRALEASKASAKVLLVDACRNDPQSTISKDARQVVNLETVTRPQDVAPPGGISAFFSCSVGQQSFEPTELKHGIFFHYVIQGLGGGADLDKDQEISMDELAQFVTKNVKSYARNELGLSQVPERRGEARGLLTLATLGRPVTASLPSKPTPQTLQKLVGSQAGEKRSDNRLNMELIWCPAGRFTLGSPPMDRDRRPDEGPVAVTLSQGFWLGKYEVTQRHWRQVMGTTPWKGEENEKEGDDFPATHLTWNDAVQFCRKLTNSEVKAGWLPPTWKYDLPTEAQWEYACRAGTATRYSFGDNDSLLGQFAWYENNADDVGEAYAHPVGLKSANAWGLHDMHGNVWEWCRDLYHQDLPGGRDPVGVEGTDRVFRGGGWSDAPRYCRSTSRFRNEPSYRYFNMGFRVARVPSSN